ncbi:MAG: bacterioferritin-associated ferredoxin [Myxococcota bacterium]
MIRHFNINMIVCVCKGVSDRAIKKAVTEGASSVSAVARVTTAGTDCGSCVCEIKRMLAERRSSGTRDAARLLATAAGVV